MIPAFYELSVIVVLIALTAGVLKLSPALSKRVLGVDQGRSPQLDGLRGLLSLLVVVHHCIIFRLYATTGSYLSPDGNAENLAGDASVALFFMITAYLLWGRMLRTGGTADWQKFYWGRFRRLTPMYMVAVLGLVVIVLVETGFKLQVSPLDFALQVLRWMGFGLLPQADINGRDDTHAILVVLWTLKYEWIFYLAMPLLAVFAKSKLAWLLYALALLVAFPLGDSPLYGYFVAGAIAAHLIARPKLSIPVFVRVIVSLAALVGLVAGYHDIYGIEQIILLFLIFQGVVTGAGPWGLLRAKSLRFLGVISYRRLIPMAH